LYGAYVWARRALNSNKRLFSARAGCQGLVLRRGVRGAAAGGATLRAVVWMRGSDRPRAPARVGGRVQDGVVFAKPRGAREGGVACCPRARAVARTQRFARESLLEAYMYR
jgi:hypothetical protein